MASRNLLMLVLAAWVMHLAVPLACLAEPAAGDTAQAPFTVLFDTGAASASPLPPEALAAKTGWTTVPEDNLTRAFTGDAVFMNDRAAVVLRHGSAGAEIYSRSPASSKQRAALLAIGADRAVGALSGVKIIENSQAAVMLEAAFTSKTGAVATFRFRLTAGEALLDVRGAQGASRLRVCDRAQYVVVPDFFADDMVFDPAMSDPAAHDGTRIGLPAENSVLGLTDDGQAIVACVWRSPQQNVDLLLSGEGAARTIAGYEIDLPADSRLWIAVMEGAGIWHARRMADQKSGAELMLDWKPPMPARWRADFAAADGAALSGFFPDVDAGAASENVKSDGPCRFDAGRAMVRMMGSIGVTPLPRIVVVYPIERTRTTPLTAFCLVDIMRNALGVGPCQYVLDAEGLRAGDNPTPDQVTRWVENQFEKKPAKRDTDAIHEQLTKMTVQVNHTDARIRQYIDFAGRIKQACTEYAKSPENAAATTRLLAIADGMTAPGGALVPMLAKLADEVAAQAEQPDALAKSQASITAIRVAGATQDYALAKLRMAARRLKQECRTLAARDPKAAAFAGQIQQQAEQMLAAK